LVKEKGPRTKKEKSAHLGKEKGKKEGSKNNYEGTPSLCKKEGRKKV